MLQPAVRAALPAPTAPWARRADVPYVDVEVAFCQVPASAANADLRAEDPPIWQLRLVGSTLEAQLGRVPPPGATLAALDDPFACRITASPAQVSATAVPLASAAPRNATDAYTAYLCSDADAAAGFGLSSDAGGAVYATRTNGATPSCPSPTARLFAPLQADPILLQQAPTATTGAVDLINGTYTYGGISLPSAAAAVFCAPLIASAVANYNYSQPLASIQASLEQNGQNRLFAAVGPVGGSIILALIGGVMAATAGGVARAFAQRRSNQAATATPQPPDDPARDFHAIALTPPDAATPATPETGSKATTYGRISTSGYAPLNYTYR